MNASALSSKHHIAESSASYSNAPIPNAQSLPATSWPSHIAQKTSTIWLLPPCSNQAASIAQLLRTEIEAHNISREMLHATENQRIEAVQKYNRVTSENQTWSAAYNSLTAALHRCSEEFARVSTENESLRAQLQALDSQIFRLDPIGPKEMQIKVLRKIASRQLSMDDSLEDGAEAAGSELWLGEDALAMSPYSTGV